MALKYKKWDNFIKERKTKMLIVILGLEILEMQKVIYFFRG